MATKSKNPKPFLSWLCFFLAFNLSLALLAAGVYLYGQFPLYSSYTETDAFQVALYKFSLRMQECYTQLKLLEIPEEELDNPEERSILLQTYGEDPGNAAINLINEFNTQYNNVDYFFDSGDGISFSSEGFEALYTNEDGREQEWFAQNYAFTMYFDGTVFEGSMNHKGYAYTYGQAIRNLFYWNDPNFTGLNTVLFVALPDQLEMGDNFYLAYQSWEQTRQSYLYLAVAGLLALLLWILTILFRRGVSQFQKSLAGLFSHILLEAKLTLLIGWGVFSSHLLTAKILSFGDGIYAGIAAWISSWFGPDFILSDFLLAIGILWLSILILYLTLVDLVYNRGRYFTHNLVTLVFRLYTRYEMRYTFQKKFRRRFVLFLTAEILLSFLTTGLLFAALQTQGETFVILLLCCITLLGCILYLSWKYFKRYIRFISEVGDLIDHVDKIKHGNMDAHLHLDPSSDLYALADNLNTVQNGLRASVERHLRSERMKVELITNVSHDLKTPLTSIINYVELLKNERLDPDYANDYVKILDLKANRLKTMVQDLFDISKANSGNISINIEKLDLVALLEQTLAELEERIDGSGLDFKVYLPNDKIYVNADGSKLYRVLENLINNALKYALKGTRVYINLAQTDSQVFVIFKNIANYEMNFTGREIIERFKRGDETRSSEGSGLGLSIAKSFLEIQGGSLEIEVDGDLFKATVILPRAFLPSEYLDKKEDSALQAAQAARDLEADAAPFLREIEATIPPSSLTDSASSQPEDGKFHMAPNQKELH